MNDVMAMSQAVQAVMRTFDKHSLDSLQCLTVMAQIVAVMAAMVLEQDEIGQDDRGHPRKPLRRLLRLGAGDRQVVNKIAPITVLKPGDRPAGGVTTFVRNVVREIVQGRDRNVPCDGCTSCRRAPSLHVDHLTEEEIRTLRAVRHPDIGIVLEKNPDGSWGQPVLSRRCRKRRRAADQ